MKKVILTSAAVLLLTAFSGCKKDYFDQVPDDRLTLDETFKSRNTAEQFLANVYSQIPDEAAQRFASLNNAGPWTGASDEADYDWSFVITNSINIGAFDASSGFVGDYWRNFYQGIRSATIFMQNADRVTDLPANLKVQYKAEARALRAIYYFYLMRIYGPVILLGDQVIEPDAATQDMQLPRNTFDDCVNYVTSELDAAAKDLPAKPTNDNNYGRITSSFALAMKSEVLLYAASPLFNGNTEFKDLTNKDGKVLINQQYDVNKWKKAADAAKDFITKYVPSIYNLYRKNDLNGNFSPYLSCRDVMLDDWNPEIIYARIGASVSSRQYETTPYHNGYPDEVRGSGGLAATQGIVDTYYTQNGRPITDPQSGYVNDGTTVKFQAPDDDQPRDTYRAWANREPRFYVGITYNGRRWLDTNVGDVITELFLNGNSGRATGGNDYSTTGYIVRKNMSTGDRTQGNRSWVMLRLAEIYLNYVEALNESNPGDPDIVKYLNLIRNRAGIPEYGTSIPVPAGQDAMREAIRRERHIELSFENDRYFAVRRWKIAPQTDNGLIFGLTPAPLPYFYGVIPIENRVFSKKNYFFPIPQGEINTDKQLVQNPGW
ncbi:RagB/SusD family nutrient uptake outer membrane protein [Mucilaginibacter sp. RS28]|uniref:RagB/SusD family nutrient uptake outer membrane protein n=1 Tax=Mucilaginibacter straminoryzae TaxID=2932774 RepID=A0A9X1X2C7_9SPHI|nr:RagB/SusD family nutrient uptake outer membrane protein [Mucilaginibacter straminoryzae]MCJ8209576.1 RagB/SusD family nutrient uptake outer membrane protein [Mucilaginibacter straminoryzae]